MVEEVKVLGSWGSPFSRRVELALRLKGVQYEYIEEEDLYGKKSPLLLKSNPVHKKIPVFFHNEKPIPESLVIIEYIDEIWKGYPILPEDPYDKAMTRFWAKFVDDKCLLALWKAGWSPENEREKAVEEACECLKTLQGALNGKRFFGGDTIGLVDIAANFIAYWLKIIQELSGHEMLSAEKFPELFKWTEEFASHPIVKETLPSKDKLLALFKAHIATTTEAKTSATN